VRLTHVCGVLVADPVARAFGRSGLPRPVCHRTPLRADFVALRAHCCLRCWTRSFLRYVAYVAITLDLPFRIRAAAPRAPRTLCRSFAVYCYHHVHVCVILPRYLLRGAGRAVDRSVPTYALPVALPAFTARSLLPRRCFFLSVWSPHQYRGAGYVYCCCVYRTFVHTTCDRCVAARCAVCLR